MKQSITIEQWDELIGDDKYKVLLSFYSNPTLSLSRKGWFPELTIGQLIEFLGDDLWSMKFKGDHWIVYGIIRFDGFDSLIDNLWEAVKYKLKDKQ